MKFMVGNKSNLKLNRLEWNVLVRKLVPPVGRDEIYGMRVCVPLPDSLFIFSLSLSPFLFFPNPNYQVFRCVAFAIFPITQLPYSQWRSYCRRKPNKSEQMKKKKNENGMIKYCESNKKMVRANVCREACEALMPFRKKFHININYFITFRFGIGDFECRT